MLLRHAAITETPVSATSHVRTEELIEELTPELEARGYHRVTAQPLWTRDHPQGLVSLALSFSPDDAEGGWIEPFVGLLDQRVESLAASVFHNRRDSDVIRHTLLIGSTKWYEPSLERQPIHSRSDVLEVTNALLSWWGEAMPSFERQFARSDSEGLAALSELFNTDHPQASRYASHPLTRSVRGLAVTKLYAPAALTDTLGFHRERLKRGGYWDLYGEQVQAFVMSMVR